MPFYYINLRQQNPQNIHLRAEQLSVILSYLIILGCRYPLVFIITINYYFPFNTSLIVIEHVWVVVVKQKYKQNTGLLLAVEDT